MGGRTSGSWSLRNIPGYGAIAVALHPNGYGSILGITLGKRSVNEAHAAAIKACLKAGGTHPVVKSTWKE